MILRSVEIENFLMIDYVKIAFDHGLTVISGESGTGKSTIIDAICWCIGLDNKRNKDLLNARVVIEFSSQCNVSREGKNTFKIDGKKINKRKILQREFLTICRQDHRLSFSTKDDFRSVIDNLLDDKSELDKLKIAYINYKSINNEIKQLNNIYDEDLDYMRKVISEIESLNLAKNNEEKLVMERREKIEVYKSHESLVKAMQIFKGNGSMTSIVSQFNSIFKHLNSSSPIISKFQQRIEYITNELHDIELSIEDIIARSDSNDAQLDVIDKKLGLIRSTARKYSVMPNALLSLLDDYKKRLYLGENLEVKKERLGKKLALAEEQFSAICIRINELRAIICDDLNSKIRAILDELMMNNVDACFELHKTTWSEYGDVQIRMNIGRRILSGGEVSRLLLAIKIATASLDIPIIFDEIDIGVGGMTAHKIGSKLRELSNIGQVIVVTHQAQVAAYSVNHILVTRHNIIKIEKLSIKGRIKEVARMISGSKITNESLSAAKKLIEESI